MRHNVMYIVCVCDVLHMYTAFNSYRIHVDLCICAVSNVYSFPVLTLEFTNLLLEELDHFEKSDMPKGRPNTMNNYGVSSNS